MKIQATIVISKLKLINAIVFKQIVVAKIKEKLDKSKVTDTPFLIKGLF
jgi:hypothetical protein